MSGYFCLLFLPFSLLSFILYFLSLRNFVKENKKDYIRKDNKISDLLTFSSLTFFFHEIVSHVLGSECLSLGDLA